MFIWLFYFLCGMTVGLFGLITIFDIPQCTTYNWEYICVVCMITGFSTAYYSLMKIFMTPTENSRRLVTFDKDRMKFIN